MEYLFVANRLGQYPFRKDETRRARLAVLLAPADRELVVVHQPYEGSSESEKVAGAQDELLHELIDIGNGTEFRGDADDLMKFMGLGTGFGIEFCV